jgi:beta-lactamase regulating signal transducer with metallopeptidase domain
MIQIYQAAFPQALGWSLSDSLWQMGLLWIAYTLLTFNGRKGTPGLRFNLAFILNAAGTLLFFLNFTFNYFYSRQHGVFHFLSLSITNALTEKSVALIPALSFVYLIFLTAYIFRLVITSSPGIFKHSADDDTDQFLKALLAKVSMKTGIVKTISLKISDRIISPFTTGFLKPAIILPFGLSDQLTIPELETILAHELSHIKRNDYLLNILLIASEAIFFFNPFARLLTAACRRERENACDDMVLAAGFDRMVYGSALLALGRFSVSQSAMPLSALAATGKSNQLLLQRINRIFKLGQIRKGWLRPLGLFFLCLLVNFLLQEGTKKQIGPGAETTMTPATDYASSVVFGANETDKTGKEKAASTRSLKVSSRSVKTSAKSPVTRAPKSLTAEENIPEPPVPPDPVIKATTSVLYISEAVPATEYSIHFSTPNEPPVQVGSLTTPYVPASSFYYPDIRVQKKAKAGRIVHL